MSLASSSWKPLDDQSRDGYAYLMRVPGSHGFAWCIGRWDHEWNAFFQCFDSDHGTNVRIDPTHYMAGPQLDEEHLSDTAGYKREGE